MYIDFSHMTSYNHEDPEFMRNIVTSFYKFEPDLRKGLTKFMQHICGQDAQAMRRSYYTIAIYNLPQMNKIRELRTLNLGRLMSIYGTVTRTTDAKPELILGTFLCAQCNNVVKNVEQQFKFTEPVRCSNEGCGNKNKWNIINQESVFVDW